MTAGSSQILTGRESLALQVQEQAAGARLEIRLGSFELDGRLYDSARFVETIKVFLLASERSRLRVLVNQTRAAVSQSPRLVEPGRRLSSRVEFRSLAEQDRGEMGERLIIDARAVLERRSPEALQSRLLSGDPAGVLHVIERFDALWTRGCDAPELRALNL